MSLFWVKLVGVAVITAGLLLGLHFWKDSIREEGRAEVRNEWAAAKASAERAATASAKRAEIDATARGMQRDKDFAALRTRNKRLEDELAILHVDGLLLGELRDSVRTSNDQGAGDTPADTAAPTGATGLEVSQWFDEVAKFYRACREQVIGWIEWDDRRVRQ